MSDLIISYQLWTWIGAILTIQRTGRKRQQFLLCPLYHLNHRKLFQCWKCQFFTDYPPHKAPFWGLHPSLSFIYLCGCWCPLSSVSSLFFPLWFGTFFSCDWLCCSAVSVCCPELVYPKRFLYPTYWTRREKVFLVVDFPPQKLQQCHNTDEIEIWILTFHE